ncbi:MAG: hypothetical protein WCS54_03930 [Fibrobacteraceae bacterium]
MKFTGALPHFAFACLCAFALLCAAPVKSHAVDAYDSASVNTLNMTDEEVNALLVDSTKVKDDGPTLEQRHEDEQPQYVKREYNHRQQVIVGGVIMLCVALVMVMMNNYNPTR